VILDDLRGWMKGEDCVVVGCGPSAHDDALWDLTYAYQTRWLIACNRAVTWCDPDFAVCVEPRRDKAMWKIINDSSPLIVFSHIDKPHPRAVLIGSKDVQEWVHPSGPLPEAFSDTPLRLGQSPFYAAAVAILLGFETIGLIGVDMTKDRYPNVKGHNAAYARLAAIGEAMGSRLINLSTASRLESIPQGTWDEVRTK